MKRLVVVFLLSTFFAVAQTGIGTTTPVNKFQIEATTANPASSGSSANGNLRLSGSSGSHILDFGLSSTSTFAWLQARSKSNYATLYDLAFNPIGGKVGIGNSAPSATLTVGNEGGTIGGEILLNPTSTQYEGGQIIFKRSLLGGTVDWTLDQFGTTSANARFRIFNGASETNGIAILENGNVGLGTAIPTSRLNLEGGGIRLATGFSNSTNRPALNSGSIGNYEIRGVGTGGSGTAQNDGGDDGLLRLSAGGGTNIGAQSSIDISGFSTVSDMNKNIVMRTGGTERLRINADGNVGIGTASPLVPLHVASYVSQYVNTYGYLSQSNVAGSYAANTNVLYSIMADQRIRAPEFNAISDARIKKGITLLNTESQLSALNKLQVVNYTYIDQLANGNKNKTGFIAQEVEAVNAQFVNQTSDFIPSVFALAKSVQEENDVLKITLEKPHGFAKGDVIKFFVEGKREVVKTIDEVKDLDSFSVIGWTEQTTNLFIYGKKVADFRAIDFDQITALSVGAIQELSKQVDSLKIENEKLNKEIQVKQSDFENRLKLLESKIK
ncbi:MAG: hypothetical protein RL284_1126 [Bacteroidota bacterium]|jgi:hypothetical protein